MKLDERDGHHYLIEANVGRPTGRSAIAEAGGVELVYTMYCDAAGLSLPEHRQQQYRDAKWIYWRRDIRSAWHYFRRGELSAMDWLRSLRGPKACAVYSSGDLAPFLNEVAKSLAAPARRLRGK